MSDRPTQNPNYTPMKRAILLLLAALLPCIPASLHSGEPVPVLPAGYGFYSGGVYSITDKSGKRQTGVVVGDDKFSMTIPHGKEPVSIRCLGSVITLD